MALKELRLNAEQGDAVAQYDLAGSYAAGKNVAKDLKAALYWFEKAASAGQPNAQTSLGWAYMSNELVGIIGDGPRFPVYFIAIFLD